jgi:hypothetical protein
MEPYVVVEGVPRADPDLGASFGSKAGSDSAGTVFAGDTNTSTLSLNLGADAIRWVPRSQDIVENGVRWWPVGATSGPNIGFGGTVKPKLDAAYNYQGQYRRLPKPSIDFSENGYAYLHVDNMPAATLALVTVLHPGSLDYYGLFEAARVTGEPLVLRYHHGQMRVYQDERQVVNYESESGVSEPTIILLSLDTVTDAGRFLCVDRSRVTRSFSIPTMDQVGFTGTLGALGAGTTANPWRYFADMDLLEVDLWPRALEFGEMQSVASKLAMVYGVPG